MKAKTILQFSIGPIGAALLSLVTLPFVAWFFSVEDVGRLTMLQVVLSLSVSLFSLAMHQAYVREYHEEDDKQALFKACVIPGLAALLLVSGIIIILPFSMSKLLFGIDSALLTFLLLVGVLASFFINFLVHVVRMQERGLVFSATQLAPKLFLFIFISLIMILNLKADFETLMSCTWCKRKKHQIFLGESGDTKLKVASVIGNSHLNKGVRVKAVPLKRLMFDLQIALGKDKFKDVLKALNQYQLLIVHDWQIQSLRIDDIPLLTLLIESRKSPLLITSHLSKSEWNKDLTKLPLPLSISTELRQESRFWSVSEPKNKSLH